MAPLFGQMKGWEMPMPKPDILVKSPNIEPDCEDEHISHARHILSFYKFQVHGVENLIDHHNQSQEARGKAEKELKEVQDALEKTKIELGETNKQLATTRNELKANITALNNSKEALKTTEKKLSATQKELATTQTNLNATKTQLQTTQADLNQTKDRLKTSEGKLQQTTAELTNTKATLKQTTAHLTEQTTRRENFEKSYMDGKKSYAALEDKLAEANKSQDEALEKANSLEKAKDAAEKNERNAQNELRDFRLKGVESFLNRPNRSRGKFYIEHATYGGKVINDQVVIDKLLSHAVEGKSFRITNEFFGGDPWKGPTKAFTAVYAVNGKGPFRSITQKEAESAKFE